MRFVEKAVINPMRCAVLPQIGANHDQGYIDSGSEMIASGRDQHVYVSVVAVREMARLLGFPSPEEFAEVESDRDAIAAELADAQEDLAKADTYLDAIDVIESRGFATRRKTGRPPKRAAAIEEE